MFLREEFNRENGELYTGISNIAFDIRDSQAKCIDSFRIIICVASLTMRTIIIADNLVKLN